MTNQNDAVVAQNKQYTLIIYVLQLVSLVTGITAIIGVVMNYLKRDEVRGTILESHFEWQIKTFWWMLLWVIVGSILTIFVIGALVFLAAAIWYIYRAVKGLIHLNENKPMAV